MSVGIRPMQPRVNRAVVDRLRVRHLYVPLAQNFIHNLVGSGFLAPGTYAYGAQRVRMGPGGYGVDNDGTSDDLHFSSNNGAVGPLPANDATVFGVLSFRTLGTNRQVLSFGNSDSRFEMRIESDDVNGLAIAYWDNYVIGQRYSVGSLPQLNVPIAFVGRYNASNVIKLDLSNGTRASGASSGFSGHSHGHCDMGVRHDGHFYMAGCADGMWSDAEVARFLDNPYELIGREVDAPIVVSSADDVFASDEHLFFDDQMTAWTDFASMFPGDGSGYFNYQDVPASNTITPNGTQIVFVSNWQAATTSKASIQKEGYDISNPFRFYAGDIIDVLLSLKIEGGAEDTTVLDFEFDPDYINTGTNSPGPRVMINAGKVCLDLSEIGGTTIAGSQDCPIGSFFRLRMYLELSPESIGRAKIWVDGALSVDHSGANMADKTVFAGLGVDFRLPTYIGRVEFGVTANQDVNPTMTVTTEYAQFRQRLVPRHGLSMMGCGKAVW